MGRWLERSPPRGPGARGVRSVKVTLGGPAGNGSVSEPTVPSSVIPREARDGMLPHLPEAELRPKEQGEAHRSVPLRVIANLGVDALSELVVTIDPARNRVYFEAPAAAGGGSGARAGGR